MNIHIPPQIFPGLVSLVRKGKVEMPNIYPHIVNIYEICIYTSVQYSQIHLHKFVQVSDIYKCTCVGVRYCHGGAIVQPGEIDSRPTW